MKLPIARVGVGSSAGLLIRAAMIFISLNIVRAIPASPLAFMGGFPVEPLDKSRFRQGADPKFCASREPRSCITAMSSAANKDLSAREKTREEELQILAKTLSLDSSSLLELLAKQRNKMDGSTEKAKHIDWLLKKQSSHTNLPAGTKGGSILRKSNGSKPNAESSAEGTSVEKQQKRARPRRPKIVTQKAAESRADAQKRQEDALKDPTLLTNIKFNERDDLHPSSKRALIDVMGLSTMTEIQAKTYAAALSGRDVLGRARTGTGKTVAFLLPAVERVLRSKQYQAGHNVGILIISPTRELAMQIGDEAEKLLTFHSEMSVQVAYGGTKKGRDTNQLQKRLPTVFVATPGRLQDLLESARIHGRKFSEIMSTTPVVVLDETDRLLDMGFRREIKKILNYLPRNNKRQTLLFSATVPKELKSIMAETMNKDYIEVDCIGDGAETTQTALRVKQSHVLIPSTNEYIQSVIKIVQEVIKDGDGNSKAVVFFPTAKMVAFFSDIMREVVGIDVMELHSKKTQSTRNRVSGQFRDADTGLLFTSDVSARGVDYPGVSHVVQFGLPASQEQYIHRLGRTGRAGSAGKGWLVLGKFESMFLQELKGFDIPHDTRLANLLNAAELKEAEDLVQMGADRVSNGDQLLSRSASGAYQSFLGYYLGQMKRIKMRNKEDLVDVANTLSSGMGFKRAPGLTKRMVGKMGLKGVRGIEITEDEAGHGQVGGRRGHFDGRRSPNAGRSKRKGR